MSIKSVEVVPGCISCHTCESVCPGIFKVDPTSKVINHDYLKHAKEIFKAEKLCPVQVIKVVTENEAENVVELDSATVSNIEYLTPDTVELRLAAKGFSFKPGQYASIFFNDADGEFSRAYSIVSGDSSGFTLTIKLLPNGRGAKAIRAFKGGETLKYSGGIGHFVLRDTPAHKVLVATGTGLAPMIAMLEAAPAETKKTVVFGVRNEEDLFYAEKLRMFENTEVVITVSRPSDSWTGKSGRVTDHLSCVTPESEVYICGNPDMVESVVKAMESAGHPASLVSHESFVAQGGTNGSEKAAANADSKPSCLTRFFVDGEVPGVEVLNWLLIAASAAVPFVWWLFPAYKDELWSVSWITVVTLMCIRPLADIFPKILFFRSVLPLRKGLGILSASIVVTSLAFTLAAASSKKIISTYFSAKGWGLASRSAFARISEITAVLLLITSNSFSQKLL
ncbi:MAG: FAD-binding oxidoreductase [Patescibacteria group bacterium]